MSDWNAIYNGINLSDLNTLYRTTPERPLLGVAIGSESLWLNVGNGWVEAGLTGSSASGANFSTNPTTLTAVTGKTTYALPQASVNPSGSFLILNGIKQVFSRDYSVSGSTLTILSTNPTPPMTGDTLQLYFS
jgi:hypothetical protein